MTPRTPQNEPIRAAGKLPEVLDLSEVAAFLRVREQDVVNAVYDQDLPGRMVGSEWRFLRSALETWLQTKPPQESRKPHWKEEKEIPWKEEEEIPFEDGPASGAHRNEW
jgi:excisionase family DNA binding protein